MADENSENNSGNNSGNSRKRAAESDGQPQTCRDFLRNACTRGKACRYYHPEDVRPNNKLVEFCHDYQNRGRCRRVNCKYLHCTEEEEKIYHETGILPFNAGGMPAPPLPPPPPPINATPICKDFLNGVCTRSLCKFRHVDDRRPFVGMDDKRRRLEYDSARMEYVERMRMLDDENMFLRRRLADREDEIVDLRRRLLVMEGENENLQRKLLSDPQCIQLKKQVADLASMNEILLEQNARLKLNSTSDGGAAYGHKNMTPVSMSGSVSQTQNYLDQLDQKYSFGQSGGSGRAGGGIRYM